ncbi:hypothetical protein PCASD_13929 [Puccinia coronata f. sp. avenae]|uniref:Uncharacterized protein n=1 Tax=Puccinia coronata f. sp. avenae TaxID=200324 RepID=A0A2N5UHA0_9BASI|nr:hypothetical protein PCASD_23521 [Puccinia coronata f. sp. avenae]PLW37129.1 hypothetical protein PCASD_13929 [Puccinia coronata f. sp. avenae]
MADETALPPPLSLEADSNFPFGIELRYLVRIVRKFGESKVLIVSTKKDGPAVMHVIYLVSNTPKVSCKR